MASTKVPSAWDEEDWERLTDKSTAPPTGAVPPVIASRRPNPAAPPFNPPAASRLLRPSAPEFDHTAPLLYTPSSGGVPKTLYRPEIKIMKRSSPDAAGGVPVPAATCPPEENEKDRRERELKNKERRYKEARDRIMGESTVGKGDPATATTGQEGGGGGGAEAGGGGGNGNGNGKGKKGNQKNGKRSPDSSQQRTPKSSNRTSPTTRSPSSSSRTRTPIASRKPSPPRSSGAITGFSLNGGAFTAPPATVSSSNRYYAQREPDAKLLESQLHADLADAHLTAETDVEGLDWDSFSRDTATWPRQQQQQQHWGGQQQQQQWNTPPQQQGQQQGGYYQAGLEYGYTTATPAISGYGSGYDYTTASTSTYDYTSQLPPTRQMDPGIYGGAATVEYPRYGPAYPTQTQAWSEKGGKQPGAGQMGVVQAVRAPRGPDPDGGRGFRGRGAGGRGVAGVVVGIGGLSL